MALINTDPRKTLPLVTLMALINADRGKSLPLITLMPLINTDRGKSLPLMNADKRGSAQISISLLDSFVKQIVSGNVVSGDL
jgi:hypothetical protein